jgi:hypothetical protein
MFPTKCPLSSPGRLLDNHASTAFAVLVPPYLNSFVGFSYMFKTNDEMYHKRMMSPNAEPTLFYPSQRILVQFK